MSNNEDEVFKNLLLNKMGSFSNQEQRFIRHILEGQHITRNINEDFDNQLTLGQRVADKVASFGGSWTFIIIFGMILVAWVILNSLILTKINKAFDPFPYILLNLFLSMTAAIQAPVIMMSQNRQSVKDRLNAAHDYEVNMKAEMEIATLHVKFDELREKKWTALIEMQQEQIRLLTQVLEKRTD
jgi:uncharacterized membrane protein